MDDEMADAVARIEAMGVPPWHALSVESARRVEDDVFTADDRAQVAFVRNLSIPGPRGKIPIRVYRPDVRDAPVVVFYHGGGWTLGTLDSIDGVCRELANRAECVVVSVDYRLAPEHPFPAGVDDAVAALEWAADHAETFGGDPTRLGVAGTSAGGNLAAVTALYARDFGGPTLSHQSLLYPITNHAFDTDSYEENGDGPLLTRADMEWFWSHYLRSPVDGRNPFASPLRARDLSDLPPATVVTCGHDPLRDEGIAYADRLADAGVSVAHDHYPGMAHGFLSLTGDVTTADEAMDAVASSLGSM
ncbi:alpha/beta hydrolase [Haladaptatus sp. T7]|uniref:alpha/beta hydrolase n=1 Tax=Haladaptatus sp. T7 TaxID=2029368 RepID=UPI0021A256F5|nr:alpha/beta hydrolase [Haladaptatus sp. T7]GKZ13334.1 acetylhydrolase [Haladaptatus sp. T7]